MEPRGALTGKSVGGATGSSCCPLEEDSGKSGALWLVEPLAYPEGGD